MIPGARYRTMPGLGHFPMSEHPEKFLVEIRPVLERILATGVASEDALSGASVRTK